LITEKRSVSEKPDNISVTKIPDYYSISVVMIANSGTLKDPPREAVKRSSADAVYRGPGNYFPRRSLPVETERYVRSAQ
jgi:hypothetical protein